MDYGLKIWFTKAANRNHFEENPHELPIKSVKFFIQVISNLPPRIKHSIDVTVQPTFDNKCVCNEFAWEIQIFANVIVIVIVVIHAVMSKYKIISCFFYYQVVDKRFMERVFPRISQH